MCSSDLVAPGTDFNAVGKYQASSFAESVQADQRSLIKAGHSRSTEYRNALDMS
jgi:hypothetical protein